MSMHPDMAKGMVDFHHEDTRHLVKEIRLQNQAARAQQQASSPQSQTWRFMGQRLYHRIRQLTTLFEEHGTTRQTRAS
jgi:hypothetical protein